MGWIVGKKDDKKEDKKEDKKAGSIPGTINFFIINYVLLFNQRGQFKIYLILSKGKYEDGVMIHSMYELGLESYGLSLLKWDSIAEDKTIKYFDHRSRSVKELKLSDNLYSELIYLKSWKRLKNLQINNEERKSLDKTTIVGGFIFSSKPTGIFNKFKRGFGECLKGFNITPKDLILLSKWDEKSRNKKLYSRTNC